MAETKLNTSTSGGDQLNTGDPQQGVPSIKTGTDADEVQTGTSQQILENIQGIQLSNRPVTVVDLSTQSADSGQTAAQAGIVIAAQSKSHIEPALIAVPAGLLIVAVVSIWLIQRSVKNTTNRAK